MAASSHQGMMMRRQSTEATAKRRSVVGASVDSMHSGRRVSFGSSGSLITQHATAAGARRHSAGTIRRRMMSRKTVEHIPVSDRGVGTAGATAALAPAMLKPQGREYLFVPAIFSHIFAYCSLNFHSLSLCCLHTIKTSHSVGTTGTNMLIAV